MCLVEKKIVLRLIEIKHVIHSKDKARAGLFVRRQDKNHNMLNSFSRKLMEATWSYFASPRIEPERGFMGELEAFTLGTSLALKDDSLKGLCWYIQSGLSYKRQTTLGSGLGCQEWLVEKSWTGDRSTTFVTVSKGIR